ncbi:ABC transporter ATP-binding protein [Spiroplasma floricola]|uniref:ABC transporter ATP-binding protein/permease n=1 Tax=Spiroplasma floricola 23-6 TaxID=1336749 RepID=A0A2K8SDS4_9MOLU|nr:ABC transporter ATP-binding protein [Spiroplasma floricola]AUB31601.1 ABC transporter ATP-binding protein/permease [Spiroplasma floricola 23-6]
MIIKKRKKVELYVHLFNAMKNKKILTFLMFMITVSIALLLIWNIKAIEYITALLVSKSVLDSMLSLKTNDIYEIIKQLGLNLTQEQIDQILNSINVGSSVYEQIIQKFFYDFVHYDGQNLSITLFGKNFGLYALSFSMIFDVTLVVILSYINFIISGHIAQAYETQLKRKLINKIIDQDLHYFNSNKTGQLISTIVKDSSIVSSYIKEAPIIYFLSTITISFSAILMFNISWKLALCVFGLLLAFMLIIFITIIISNKATRKISKISQGLDNELSEKIYNIRLVKSVGTFKEEKQHFDEMIDHVSKKKKKKFFASEVPSALIIGGIGSFSMASIIFGVFLFYNQTQALISIMTSFTAGVIVMTIPIMQLRQIISDAPQARVSAVNVSALLESEIFIEKDKEKEINETVNSISLKNIGFAYPQTDEFIIKDFNIDLVKGKKYAFVGPTGSGKSTIAKLLLRFYDPQQGEILINNKIKLKELNLKSWLDKVGYVDQEPQILSGNIYQNVSYGLENKNHKDIIEACKKAKIHDLIMSWPDQYETILFERGAQLSGGQKQRLVIARLILKNPEILILDEATSALDNIVEAEIQKELESLMEGRTTISIAHRLSTIKNFDEIYVLEQKKGIVDTGNFEKLISTEGLFKTLYQLSK